MDNIAQDLSVDMPPAELLILEVLAARYRLGEKVWTFDTIYEETIYSLAEKGLVGEEHGITPRARLVWLTDEGKKMVLNPTYVPPILREQDLPDVTFA